MKILVVCQHYWPEPYPLQDICEELVLRGHSVHVITGVPNYPMGDIYPEYRKGKNREQEHNGVRITRTFTIGRKKNAFFRLLNYISYAVSSTVYSAKLKEDYDVVFANQTSPVTMACAGISYAKKHKKKMLLYCLDLWPASLTVGGIKSRSIVYKFFEWLSKKIYSEADKILISSEMFRGYLEDELKLSDKKIIYHPQYAENYFSLLEHEIYEGCIDLMFAGNIGSAQDVKTIVYAAEKLKSHKEITWHFVGDGSELENTKKLVKKLNLKNIVFHGRKPKEEMPKYYEMADAMLVTLIPDKFISLTLPGKVQTYMASGKPIIAAADGEIKRIINQSKCGYCSKAHDPADLANSVLSFIACENKKELGENAKRYYENNFSKERFMDALEKELQNNII